MRVDKLVAKTQELNWYKRITDECKREYPIDLMEDIEEDELVIDAGCNVGGFTNAYKERFHNILPIDASSYNIEEYKKNHSTDAIHKALWSRDGEILKLKKFIGPNDDETNSGNFGVMGLDRGNGVGWIGDEYEEVETITLETLLADIDEVGLLKLDIEGAEWEFLYGKDLSKIKYITMELHNFLGEQKKDLMQWIETTHKEIYTDGDGEETHYTKAWKRII